MLKIYNAVGEHGKVILKRGIQFRYGRFDTGYNSYGTIVTARSNCQKADYLLGEVETFKKTIASVPKVDGFIQNDSFILYNPFSLEELESYQDLEDFPESVLTEDGILLFTDYVNINFDDAKHKIERLLGRHPDTGAYLLEKGAELEMSFPACYNDSREQYEVLESESKPKQLYLTKVDRTIKNMY